MSIYFDGKGNIRPELLGTESEDVAKKFVVLRPDGKRDDRNSGW